MSKRPRVPAAKSYPKTKLWDGPIPGSHEPGFVEQPLIESRALTEEFYSFGYPEKIEAHVLQMGECRIIFGLEPTEEEQRPRWHLSISCPDRHPTWDEIKTARYRLAGPDIVMAMVLPRAEDYVNVPAQDHVFQLWQLLDETHGW